MWQFEKCPVANRIGGVGEIRATMMGFCDLAMTDPNMHSPVYLQQAHKKQNNNFSYSKTLQFVSVVRYG